MKTNYSRKFSIGLATFVFASLAGCVTTVSNTDGEKITCVHKGNII